VTPGDAPPPGPAPAPDPDGLDLRKLDPGVRSIVSFIRAWGFETTDSGDGVSKPPGPDVLPFPHVVIRSTPGRLVDDARRLRKFLCPYNAPEQIEATYDPADESAVILVRWEPFA
jgi:hypothetical protein